MADMATRRQDKQRKDQESDWWLWPTALLLAMSGWGQALWIWEHTPPDDWVWLWLLLWVGVGVAGLTVAVYWLVRRWMATAWLATAVWAGVPLVYDVAGGYSRIARTSHAGLYWIAPLLLLLLLGVGVGGAMMSVGGLVARRWPGPVPQTRSLRQGFWSGLFVVMCGWLLINRAFTAIPVALLAGAVVLIETFFVIREAPRA